MERPSSVERDLYELMQAHHDKMENRKNKTIVPQSKPMKPKTVIIGKVPKTDKSKLDKLFKLYQLQTLEFKTRNKN
jgi:hypothetical protein